MDVRCENFNETVAESDRAATVELQLHQSRPRQCGAVRAWKKTVGASWDHVFTLLVTYTKETGSCGKPHKPSINHPYRW